MGFYAVPYRVLFHDTMAYGSHHFLTNFKFQCIARESLFFRHIVDASSAGAEAHKASVLLTREGYARNLAPVEVGKRVGILVSVEGQTASSVRFCFRVIDEEGTPVTCGYQTLVPVTAETGKVIPAPSALTQHFEAMAEMGAEDFYNTIHAGRTRALFSQEIKQLGKRLARGQLNEGFVQPDQRQEKPWPTALDRTWFFPGQGSFDADLMGWLGSEVDGAKALFQFTEKAAQEALGVSFLQLLESNMEPDGEALQLGIFLSAVLCGQWLIQNGQVPDLLVGHSAGELAALTVSGALSMEDGIRMIIQRVLALRQAGADLGGMLAFAGDEETGIALLKTMGDNRLELAVRNHAKRLVYAGPHSDLARLAQAAVKAGITTRKIASPFPFHTSLLAPAVEPFSKSLENLPFRQPTWPLYSPLAGRLLGDKENWPELLSTHFTQQLDFETSVAKLRTKGIRTIIHGGVNHAMLGLFRRKDDPSQDFQAPFTAANRHNSELRKSSTASPAIPSTKTAYLSEEPIALVAMGCVLPGAHDLDQYWQRLLSGESALSHLDHKYPQLGRDFKKTGKPYPDKTYTLLGGYIHDFEPDYNHFPVDQTTFQHWAKAQQFLAGAIHQCKTQLGTTSPGKTACYLGATADGLAEFDQALLLAKLGEELPKASAPAIVAQLKEAWGHMSQELKQLSPETAYIDVIRAIWKQDLPLWSVDAACASSLYTVIMGMQALRQGEFDLALCGGVFAPGPANSCLFSQFGGLSANHSRPFDIEADGVVFGEGAAFVGLKRLSQAVRDGDAIHAVLRGYGMSSDGKSASVALPKSKGQFFAIERAYAHSGVTKASIQVVEAHATATSVGDAVEFSALAQAFGQEKTRQPRLLGSVKGLIGHTGWAAGTASLIKMVLGLRQKTVPPQANFNRVNPKIDLDANNFVIPNQAAAWPQNGSLPRRCALNGFGFGGTNAHLILEEFDASYHGSLHVQQRSSKTVVVLVGWHAQFPQQPNGTATPFPAFTDEELELPADLLVLPDALDDMDSSQKIATRCAHAALANLGSLSPEVRQKTGVVFGLDGRCKRGEEVNKRLFNVGLRHILKNSPEALATLDAALAEVQPSGAYTLPGMMPNVTAGRVANLLDCHGPNFVISQPGTSLEQAVHWATSRLQDNTCDVVIAGGICQGQGSHSAKVSAPEPHSDKPLLEAGIALVFTTQHMANQQGWSILGHMNSGADQAYFQEIQVGSHANYLAGAEGALEFAACLSRNISFSITWPNQATGLTLLRAEQAKPEPVESVWPKLAEVALVAQPCPNQAPPPKGHWLVLCNSQQDDELLQWLAAHRTVTYDLVSLDALPTGDDLDLWEAATLKQIQTSKTPQRILLLSRLHDAEKAGNLAMVQGRFLLNLAFLSVRHFHAELTAGSCQFSALTMGETQPVSPSSGLFSGFAKSIAREFPKAQIRAVLSDSQALTTRLDQLERAFLAQNQAMIDWVFCRGLAKTWQAQEVVLSNPSTKPILKAGDLVIATGGGRGVTAVLVETLVKTYRCNAVLLGRTDPSELPEYIAKLDDAAFETYEATFYKERLAQTPKPHPADLRRTFAQYRKAREILTQIKRMQAHGVDVVYLAVDLTQTQALTQAMARLPKQFQSPALLIHGAGVQVSQSSARKRLIDFHRTHATKIAGLAALQHSIGRCWPDARPAVHLLTSAFSFFGNDGQPDYGAANEALNRLATAKNQDQGSWSSLAWLGWAGIGMTQGSEYAALMRSRNLYAMEADEGADLFLNVIAHHRTQAAYYLLAEGELAYYQPDWQPRPKSLSPAPKAPCQDSTFHFDVAYNPVLQNHLVDDSATLPGALFIQLAREVAQRQRGEVAALTNLVFSRFAKIKPGRNFILKAQSLIENRDSDALQIQLVSDFIHANGTVLQSDLQHFRTMATALKDGYPKPPELHLGQGISIEDPYISANSAVKLSGPYDCLQRIEIHETQQIALLVMPPAWAQALPWSPMVFVMDAMFRLAMIAIEPDSRLPLFVPSACDQVIFHQNAEPDLSQPLLLVAPKPVIEGKLAKNSGVFALDANGEPLVSFWGMQATYRHYLTLQPLPSLSKASTF